MPALLAITFPMYSSVPFDAGAEQNRLEALFLTVTNESEELDSFQLQVNDKKLLYPVKSDILME